MPARTASSTTYWMAGLSTTGSISLGWALVAGRNRVPRPAAGMTALVTVRFMALTVGPLPVSRHGLAAGFAPDRAGAAARPGRAGARSGPAGMLALSLSECQAPVAPAGEAGHHPAAGGRPMPTYEYRCKDCGEPLEVVQSFNDDAARGVPQPAVGRCARCSAPSASPSRAPASTRPTAGASRRPPASSTLELVRARGPSDAGSSSSSELVGIRRTPGTSTSSSSNGSGDSTSSSSSTGSTGSTLVGGGRLGRQDPGLTGRGGPRRRRDRGLRRVGPLLPARRPPRDRA